MSSPAHSSHLPLLPPTLFATAGVTYALVETIVFKSMLATPPETAGNAFIGSFWKAFLPPGASLAAVCSCGAATAGTWAWRTSGARFGGLSGLWSKGLGMGGWLSGGLTGAAGKRAWLLAVGSLAAVGHMAFVPQISEIVNRIINRPVDSREDIRRWLSTHYVRSALTDVVAFACFLGAWFVE